LARIWSPPLRKSFLHGPVFGAWIPVAVRSVTVPEASKESLEARVVKREASTEAVEQKFPLFKPSARPVRATSPQSRLRLRFADYRVTNWYLETGLTRDARGEKGTIECADLFEEVTFQLNVRVDKAIDDIAAVYTTAQARRLHS
jgi:hypothetical protein